MMSVAIAPGFWTLNAGCFRGDAYMFVLVRAVTYAALFIGFVLVYLPGRFLTWSGVVEPATTGAPQVAGMIMVTIGTVIALWCVFTCVFIGKGTRAPFDPPRKLVSRGPYSVGRKRMYRVE